MKDRVKKIRKTLELNQTEFGAKVGLGQQTIANIENGKINLTDRNFNLICSTFNVNPEWLRHGRGEMFLEEEKEDVLEILAEEFKLNEIEKRIVKAFLELPSEFRQGVIEFGRNFLKEAAAKMGVELSPEFRDRPPDDKLTVEEKRKIVNEELDAEEKRQMLSVSTGTSGLKRIKKSA